MAAEGRPRTLRFRTPGEGASSFVDEIRGEVRVEWSAITDFVVVRDDGSPIFFLANAVDDLEMGITHVIRGEDLIDSTHRVLALREALGGGPPPVYAHLPLILGTDRAKLSKRHGAVALEDFRDKGYLPEALCNYLSLLGDPGFGQVLVNTLVFSGVSVVVSIAGGLLLGSLMATKVPLTGVVLTKTDVVDATSGVEALVDRVTELDDQLQVVAVSAVTGEGLDALRQAIAGCTLVLIGESGAGKSTLVNALVGGDVAAVSATSTGYGLTSMRERARALPGEIEIRSTPGGGTQVWVTW